MRSYLRALGLTLGLSVVVMLSSFNALFMTTHSYWYDNLIKPDFGEKFYTFFWLFSYLCTAITVGEFVVNPKLTKYSFLLIIFVILNVAFCFTFFRLHSFIISSVVFCAIIITMIVVLIVTLKNTHHLWVCVLPNFFWYLFMFFVFLSVVYADLQSFSIV